MNQPLINQSLVDKLARALLYEGYILYPYRPSIKNTQRWTFGGIYPPAWSQAQDGTDPSLMQTQCLLESSATAALHIKVRFLHLLDRTIGQLLAPLDALPAAGTPPFKEVPSLDLAGKQYQPWQEAVERTVDLGEIALATLLAAPHQQPFSFPAQQTIEPLQAPCAPIVALLIRHQQAVNGTIELSAISLQQNLVRLTVRILNHTALPAAVTQRNDALLRSFISTHTILEIKNGKFLSQTDPPAEYKTAAAQCTNTGAWPVLVGTPPDASTLLSSPIIIEDYPKIAPESPGDLFDAGEIDEILTLRITTLTEEEKRRAASVDDRVRAMLARTESLARNQLTKLHGAMRPVVSPEPSFETIYTDTANSLKSIHAHGTILKPGDPVRLHPLGRADIMDIALDGKTATIASIEQDFENRIHLAVTIDDDPGKDLGLKGQPGHRFFFGIEEIEPLNFTEAAR